MGIANLTRHLLPYAETVSLGSSDSNGLPCQQSVVIDGPSLVYDVYHRLLACMHPGCDILDVQPTCNEVSRGVVAFFYQLASLGVEIKKICFDGALPVSKRHTRLSRIEKSRNKLELCRRQTFPAKKGTRRELASSILSTQLWRSRELPTRWKNLPENPFMVSAVFEDLLYRWNKEQIQNEFDFNINILPDSEYPWSDITMMVPGEADVECARVASITRSAILTSDSDLLVHDLGAKGSVIFLNSLQLIEPVQNSTEGVELRGQCITPHDLSRRLGIPNIQPFAYELQKDPRAPFSKLLRVAKEYGESDKRSVEYCDFLHEYENGYKLHETEEEKRVTRGMDPRVSELFWQYELPDTYTQASQFHVYLGILHEDPSRRCAWEQARTYRSLGYALFNLSRPEAQRSQSVYEFVRRGVRIVAEQVTLATEKTVSSDLDYLQKRLSLARGVFDHQSPSNFWFLFALSEVYQELANTTTPPTAKQLVSFLRKGYMGKGTDWGDIHLLAQIQAVMYSLRTLQQILHITATTYDIGPYRSILEELPPLHILMRPRNEIIQGFSEKEACHQAVHQLIKTYG